MHLINVNDVYKLFDGSACAQLHVSQIDQIIRIDIDEKPVVHAKWILIPNGRKSFFSRQCSQCGYSTGHQAQSFNYCPRCGADMRKEDKE